MTEHEEISSRKQPLDTAGPEARETAVAREIAQSVLTASSPLEIYRVALGEVTPLVEADFASVFLRDPRDPGLLRLTCAVNWPQASARHLAAMRIREGRGPTGQAVSERRAIEVEDVFADPELRDWWEPAREISFVSMIALPLATGETVHGALSFYFTDRRQFSDDDRSLLRVVAHQLAATANRWAGGLPDDLR